MTRDRAGGEPGGPVRPTRVVVDLAAIRHNAARLGELVDGAVVMAVVKADGYGHGAVPVARAALEGGATWLAVALVEEGEALRAAGVDAPVLVLTEPPVAHVDRLLDADLTPTLYTPEFGAALDAAGAARGRTVAVHLKVDTGMARVGVPPAERAALLRTVTGWRHVHTEAIWTHLARADDPDPDGVASVEAQLDRLDAALEEAAGAGLEWDLVHTANSAGALCHPRARRDLVRPGIALYGLSPSAEVDVAEHGLRPALSLVTDVRFVKRVEAGTPVSYGHRWRAPADGWLATLQVGYADGVPRALTNRAEVLVGGVRRPLVGTVCMDQVCVWFGDDEPTLGDEVVLLGAQGDEVVRVEEWAAAADTITYELVTQLTARPPRTHRG
ncbi:MAG: alanine racemase [Actinomycetes bacterium]